LTASKLYQSFTASGTVTMEEEMIKKRKGVDFKDLVHRKVAKKVIIFPHSPFPEYDR
jgi:hypothetical protein